MLKWLQLPAAGSWGREFDYRAAEKAAIIEHAIIIVRLWPFLYCHAMWHIRLHFVAECKKVAGKTNKQTNQLDDGQEQQSAAASEEEETADSQSINCTHMLAKFMPLCDVTGELIYVYIYKKQGNCIRYETEVYVDNLPL